MNKIVVILSGNNEGKTLLINKLKSSGVWVWNFSAENRLSKLSYELSWNGDRNKKYYDWLADLKELSTRYWDFEYLYFCKMIEKFMNSDKANLAIIHNATDQTVEKLKDKKYDKLFTLNIFDGVPSEEDYNKFDKVLVYNSSDFDDEVEKMFDIVKENNKGE